jgi:hypothetical protein
MLKIISPFWKAVTQTPSKKHVVDILATKTVIFLPILDHFLCSIYVDGGYMLSISKRRWEPTNNKL